MKPEDSERKVKKIKIITDGACRGNPGPGAYAYIIKDADTGEILEKNSGFLEHTTNNTAEYTALKKALIKAQEFGAEEVHIISDSQLIINQLTGKYRVNASHLKTIYKDIVKLLNKFGSYTLTHVYRNNPEVTECDELCNRTLDRILQ